MALSAIIQARVLEDKLTAELPEHLPEATLRQFEQSARDVSSLQCELAVDELFAGMSTLKRFEMGEILRHGFFLKSRMAALEELSGAGPMVVGAEVQAKEEGEKAQFGDELSGGRVEFDGYPWALKAEAKPNVSGSVGRLVEPHVVTLDEQSVVPIVEDSDESDEAASGGVRSDRSGSGSVEQDVVSSGASSPGTGGPLPDSETYRLLRDAGVFRGGFSADKSVCDRALPSLVPKTHSRVTGSGGWCPVVEPRFLSCGDDVIGDVSPVSLALSDVCGKTLGSSEAVHLCETFGLKKWDAYVGGAHPIIGPHVAPLFDLTRTPFGYKDVLGIMRRQGMTKALVYVPAANDKAPGVGGLAWSEWVAVTAASVLGPHQFAGTFAKPVLWADGGVVLNVVVASDSKAAAVAYGELYCCAPTEGFATVCVRPTGPGGVPVLTGSQFGIEVEELAGSLASQLGFCGDSRVTASRACAKVPWVSITPRMKGLCYLSLFQKDAWWSVALRSGWYPRADVLDVSYGLAVGEVVWVKSSATVCHISVDEFPGARSFVLREGFRFGSAVVLGAKSEELSEFFRGRAATMAVRTGPVGEKLQRASVVVEALYRGGWRLCGTPGVMGQLTELFALGASSTPTEEQGARAQTVLSAVVTMATVALRGGSDYVGCSIPMCLCRIGTPGDQPEVSGGDSDSLDDVMD